MIQHSMEGLPIDRVDEKTHYSNSISLQIVMNRHALKAHRLKHSLLCKPPYL